jgi:hypothetical protein
LRGGAAIQNPTLTHFQLSMATHRSSSFQANQHAVAGPAYSSGPSPAAQFIEEARAQLNGLPQESQTFRLLDALLSHAPTPQGKSVIATDIIAASEEADGFQQLEKFYITGLLLPCRSLFVIVVWRIPPNVF